MDFILGERRCCTFLRFGLSLEPDMGPIGLTLGGSQQAKDFLKKVVAGLGGNQ